MQCHYWEQIIKRQELLTWWPLAPLGVTCSREASFHAVSCSMEKSTEEDLREDLPEACQQWRKGDWGDCSPPVHYGVLMALPDCTLRRDPPGTFIYQRGWSHRWQFKGYIILINEIKLTVENKLYLSPFCWRGYFHGYILKKIKVWK